MKKNNETSKDTLYFLLYGRRNAPSIITENGIEKETYFDGDYVNKITKLENGAILTEKYNIGDNNGLIEAGVELEYRQIFPDYRNKVVQKYLSKEDYNKAKISSKVTTTTTLDKTIINTIEYDSNSDNHAVLHITNLARIYQSGYKYEEKEEYKFDKGVSISDGNFGKKCLEYTKKCSEYSFTTDITNSSNPTDTKHTSENYIFDEQKVEDFKSGNFEKEGFRLSELCSRPCLVRTEMSTELNSDLSSMEKE